MAFCTAQLIQEVYALVLSVMVYRLLHLLLKQAGQVTRGTLFILGPNLKENPPLSISSMTWKMFFFSIFTLLNANFVWLSGRVAFLNVFSNAFLQSFIDKTICKNKMTAIVLRSMVAFYFIVFWSVSLMFFILFCYSQLLIHIQEHLQIRYQEHAACKTYVLENWNKRAIWCSVWVNMPPC